MFNLYEQQDSIRAIDDALNVIKIGGLLFIVNIFMRLSWRGWLAFIGFLLLMLLALLFGELLFGSGGLLENFMPV